MKPKPKPIERILHGDALKAYKAYSHDEWVRHRENFKSHIGRDVYGLKQRGGTKGGRGEDGQT